MSVYKKLQEARCEMQKMTLTKSGENKFAGFKYFELRDFLPTINDLFDAKGLCGIVSFSATLATLRIVDVEDGSFIEFTSPMGSAALKGCHEVQNIGAVETYQRRYLYVTALEIVENDALEASVGNPEAEAKATTNNSNPDWMLLIADIVQATGMEALKNAHAKAYKLAKGNPKMIARIDKAKDQRKAELSHQEAAYG